MGAGAIPLQVEKEFFDQAQGTYKLHVFTADVSYQGDDRVDVSTNGGYFIFVPPKQVFFDYRFGKTTASQFEKTYFAFLRNSYCHYRHAWDNTLSRSRIVLVCSCNAGDKSCHRYVIVNFLKKLGAVYKGKLKT
jgi:hypothetical protein